MLELTVGMSAALGKNHMETALCYQSINGAHSLRGMEMTGVRLYVGLNRLYRMICIEDQF